MKAKLIKVLDQYHLYDGDKAIATTIVGNPMLLPNLSKQNCDEIFGVFDVEKLTKDFYETRKFESSHIADPVSFKIGFNKAMELNKDKMFTKEDIEEAFAYGQLNQVHNQKYFSGSKTYIQSLQQPTEIEVEIVMEGFVDDEGIYCGERPKIDSEGCLMLTKI
jgi:hypothetical protein